MPRPKGKRKDESGGNVLGACEYEAHGSECDRKAVTQINGYALCAYHKKYGPTMEPRPNSAPNPPDYEDACKCEFELESGDKCELPGLHQLNGKHLCKLHFEQENGEATEMTALPTPQPPQEYLALQRVVLAVRISESTFDSDHPNPEHCPGVTYDSIEKTATVTGIYGQTEVTVFGAIGDWIVKDGSRIEVLPNDVFKARYLLKATVDERKNHYSPSQALADATILSDNLEKIIHRLKKGRVVCEKVNSVRLCLLEELTVDDDPRQEKLPL